MWFRSIGIGIRLEKERWAGPTGTRVAQQRRLTTRENQPVESKPFPIFLEDMTWILKHKTSRPINIKV